MSKLLTVLLFFASIVWSEEAAPPVPATTSTVMLRSLALPAWGAASADHYGLAVVQGLVDASCAFLILSDPNATGESSMAAMFGVMGLGLNRLISVPLNGIVSATQSTKTNSPTDSTNLTKAAHTSTSDLRAGFTAGFDGHVKFYLGSYWQWKTVTLQARWFPLTGGVESPEDFNDPSFVNYYPKWETEASKTLFQTSSWQIALGTVLTRGLQYWDLHSYSSYSMLGATASINYQAFTRTHAQAYVRYDFWASEKLPSELTAGGQILFLIW